ncbi:hypothetical protein RHMOL_Rhmol05G0230100 [Rhododendron molle]|uniref:Uncharacterized protein n=1 Tax=Rhododendron molle TaxID=49168 RepID=A0ACC0NT47_RHOML|nr:hypothetical protein RHMOL_Rhmol05G0230100 [Rhododendron molle]
MSGVFIGHLGLGQAQNGAPIRLQHMSPLYLQVLDKLVLPRKLFRGRARISATLPPSQATRNSPIPAGARISRTGGPKQGFIPVKPITPTNEWEDNRPRKHPFSRLYSSPDLKQTLNHAVEDDDDVSAVVGIFGRGIAAGVRIKKKNAAGACLLLTVLMLCQRPNLFWVRERNGSLAFVADL